MAAIHTRFRVTGFAGAAHSSLLSLLSSRELTIPPRLAMLNDADKSDSRALGDDTG